MSRKRRDERVWKPDMARQASGVLDGDSVILHDVRNVRYPAPGEPYDVRWESRRYELRKLRRLWFLVEPFHPKIPAIAHTFISFEFTDAFLALSIEARLQADQTYSIVRGLFGRYALAYSFGDERDFVLRRTYYQGHELYLYPLVTPEIEVRAVFLNMLASANALAERPRRYHSVRNNCTTVLRRHANQVRPGSFPPFMLADVMPGRSDMVLHRKGWIDTAVPAASLRSAHAVRDKANAAANRPDFSTRIREP